jgi:hypothetical protein
LEEEEEERERKEEEEEVDAFSPVGIDVESLRKEAKLGLAEMPVPLEEDVPLQSPEERVEAMKEEVERWKEKRAELNRLNADLQRKASYIRSKRGNSQVSASSKISKEEEEEEGVEKKGEEEGKSNQLPSVSPASESLLEKERQYLKLLDHIAEIRERGAQEISDFTVLSSEMQRQLERKELKVNELQESLRDFKRKVCRSAQNSRTGDPIPRSLIQQFEAVEAQKDEDLEKVRLKNIHLNMNLQRLEAEVAKKEQLAEGLHLIDFEQLKIENQSFNEKIEERSGEIEKFKRKRIMTVQVLSHLRMKVYALGRDMEEKAKELSDTEQVLSQKRDKLSSLKRFREQLKKEVQQLKVQQGFSSTDLLILDFQFQRGEMEDLENELIELRTQYESLEQQLRAYQEEIQMNQQLSVYREEEEGEEGDEEDEYLLRMGRLRA